VDVVIVTTEKKPRVLLVRRKHEPFAGRWALPGGFLDMDETLDAAAARELLEETGVATERLEQLHTFGDPGRDPRGRTVSVAYQARVEIDQVAPAAADDAAEVGWHDLASPPPLAFDHDTILACARERLQQGHSRKAAEPPRRRP
jgi:8-oxo-dGTP diphosphatase